MLHDYLPCKEGPKNGKIGLYLTSSVRARKTSSVLRIDPKNIENCVVSKKDFPLQKCFDYNRSRKRIPGKRQVCVVFFGDDEIRFFLRTIIGEALLARDQSYI